MKIKKHKLAAIALGAALGLSSLSAFALSPPLANPATDGARRIVDAENASVDPTFSRAEQAGLCLMESVVSLLAARTNDFGCATRVYDLSAEADFDGTGSAVIGDGVNLGGTTLLAALGPTRDIGTRCRVNTAPGANNLGGVLAIYNGDHGWSRKNDIFNSYAEIILRDPQTLTPNRYKEVNIKDYFKRVVAGRSWEFDWGLEDIKKARNDGFYYPVQKWQEVSWYQHENGEEGGLWVRKYQTNPRKTRGCQVRITATDLFNGGHSFEMNGTVRVGRFTGPVFGGP